MCLLAVVKRVCVLRVLCFYGLFMVGSESLVGANYYAGRALREREREPGVRARRKSPCLTIPLRRVFLRRSLGAGHRFDKQTPSLKWDPKCLAASRG